MIWDDIGYLVSKNKYNENSLISEIFTENHGKVSGIIFGGTSKKIKNYLQVGNKVHVNFNTKSENKIGYFKVEIYEALSPKFFDNRQKLSCIISAMHLIRILTAEFQKNKEIFKLIENFYVFLNEQDWIKNYIFWELDLFKMLGYDLELKNLVDKKIINDDLQYVSKSPTDKKIVPNFLIDKNENIEDLSNLLNGLKLVGDYLEKTILKPNNLLQPISRIQFINTLK
ncbi:DNA repair protein RecO [Candidatus Pelagibacter sp.]|nr:DNA repair protein RecO [Candidatus Pelagibacter sp.]